MANFNGFPVTYPQYYPQMPQVQAMPQAQPTNDRIWVQGESGAKSYLVAPNTSLTLWDSEKQSIYLKSADANGMPSIKVLDYTIRESENTPHRTPLDGNSKEYATKDEIEALRGEIFAKIDTLQKEVAGV